MIEFGSAQHKLLYFIFSCGSQCNLLVKFRPTAIASLKIATFENVPRLGASLAMLSIVFFHKDQRKFSRLLRYLITIPLVLFSDIRKYRGVVGVSYTKEKESLRQIHDYGATDNDKG